MTDPPLLRALAGEAISPPPVWLMRQAGRYLPEYRAVRAKAGGFLDLCFTPALAAEVTLQPVRRFGLDAAIIFSDILVIPYAMGQEVRFEEGVGPVLKPVRDAGAIAALRRQDPLGRLAPVYDAVASTAAKLPRGCALIGFAGAPWTVATYMVEGGGSRDFLAVKRLAYGEPDAFRDLVGGLVEATAAHLIAQLDAGAQAVQIFDTWAGALPADAYERWSLEPIGEIARRVKAAHPAAPVIAFPRGVGIGYEPMLRLDGVDAVSIDAAVPLAWARDRLQAIGAVQGNLDPAALVVGGAAMDEAVARIFAALGDGPFVFNLGHGVLPPTPPENVAALVSRVRASG